MLLSEAKNKSEGVIWNSRGSLKLVSGYPRRNLNGWGGGGGGGDLKRLHLCRMFVIGVVHILWNSMTSTSFVFTELANTIKYVRGFLYNLVFTEWRHCVSQMLVFQTVPKVCSAVYMVYILCIIKNLWSHSIKVEYNPKFGLPSIAILPWLYRKRLNPSTAKLGNWNFHPLEVVSRRHDPQLQKCENYSHSTKWG